jgi:hypothetical protein
MSVIEQIDTIIGLLDSGKPPAEIKRHVLGMREQIEAYSATADELAQLKTKYAESERARSKEMAELQRKHAKQVEHLEGQIRAYSLGNFGRIR